MAYGDGEPEVGKPEGKLEDQSKEDKRKRSKRKLMLLDESEQKLIIRLKDRRE